VSQRCGGNQWDGLHEVGPHQLPGPDRGVEEQQGHDHQRPGADGGHPDDQAAHRAHQNGGHAVDRDGGDGSLRCLGPAAYPAPLALEQPEIGLGGHRQGGEHQHAAQRGQQDLLEIAALTQEPEEQHTHERARNRAHAQPFHEAEVDGAPAQVHDAADRLHEEAGDHVARYRGEWRDAEEEHEDRRHQRAAAHAGQAHHDPHQ
jgi:hypothetical protein